MNPLPLSIFEPREVFHLLAKHRLRWLIPAGLVTLLAAFYAMMSSPVWQASQALIVRSEAANSETGPGNFRSSDEIKSVQETILELAKNRGVLAAALRQVGPPAGYSKLEAWPTERDIDALQQSAKVSPPKGVEFGTSEVFYLEVRDTDRGRLAALNSAICDQLQARFQKVRDAKSQSMVDELNKTVHLAQENLAAANQRLSAVEKQVGSDLPELRSLLETGSSDTSLRRTVTEIDNELRQAQTVEKADRELLAMLHLAKDNPGAVLAAPSRLLESQPALRRLKDGLVDAQLHTAQLQGKMSEAHPEVIAAESVEDEIRQRLSGEVAVCIRSLESDLKLATDRTAILTDQLADTSKRLCVVGGLRANYTTLVAEASHRTKLVEAAEQSLSQAQASGASSMAASLISRIDTPDLGARPVSPSRSMILLAGLAGGIAIGIGIVLLTVPVERAKPALEASDTGAPAAGRYEVAPLPRALPRELAPAASSVNLSFKHALKKLSERSGVLPTPTRS